MSGEKQTGKILKSLYGRNLWISLAFCGIALVMPYLVNVKNLGIYLNLYRSIENSDQGQLLLTSFKLVIMNAVRIMPVYMAGFTFAALIRDTYRGKGGRYVAVLGLLLIPIMYLLIDLFTGVHYDFGATSFIMMVTIFALISNDYSTISIVKKSAFVVLMIIGLQWLDIIPGLSLYGFGRGEVSSDIKLVAGLLEAEEVMTFAAILFVIIFIANALLVLKLLRDQNMVVKTLETNAAMEIELREIKLQSLRTRSSEEMQNLVHDLKSPLTSIQGLVSLSEMITTDEQITGYMKRITESVDQLNVMITEILHSNKKHRTGIDDLMRAVLSHLSLAVNEEMLTFDNQLGGCRVRINKIRFARMLTNLVNNSLKSIEDFGHIRVLVYEEEDKVIFKVEDNGTGIAKDQLDKILEPGFSTNGSSGIGLRYVESVLKDHGGTMTINSKEGVGTQVLLAFSKEGLDYEKDFGD